MTVIPRNTLSSPFEGLLATPTSRLPYQHDVLLRSYVLERPRGNVIVYNSPGVDEAADDIRALGPPDRLLINHSHESMYGQPELDVPLWIHGEDRSDVNGTLDIAGIFDGRTMIYDDLEVIPTPGHTPGTTTFLWDDGRHRFLFTGDFIWMEHGEWKAVLLDPDRRGEYLESLHLVRELDFDVLVPWGATEEEPPVSLVKDPSEKRERLDAIIARIEAGGSH